MQHRLLPLPPIIRPASRARTLDSHPVPNSGITARLATLFVPTRTFRTIVSGIMRRPVRILLRLLASGAVALVVFTALYLLALRPWHIRWGATDEEVSRAMPGDEVIPNPTLFTTRAITIRARPEEIWPWLLQMGYGRAGWYSYDRIDNAGRPSARRIVPGLQVPLHPGDRIPASPHGAFSVLAVEPERSLTLGPQAVWTFALYPQPDGTTRFVQRLRMKYSWRLAPLAVIIDVGDFVMMRKMLLNVKERVESSP